MIKLIFLALVFIAVVFGANEQQKVLSRLRAALGVEEKGCADPGETCFECELPCLASDPTCAAKCRVTLVCCPGTYCNLMGANQYVNFYACQVNPSETSTGTTFSVTTA